MPRKFVKLNRNIKKISIEALIAFGIFCFYLIPNFNNLKNLRFPFENLDILNISNFSELINHSQFLPFRSFQFILLQTGINDILITRLASVVLAVISVLFFYKIIRAWYSKRIAVFGSIVFGSSGIVLHMSRMAEPDIVYIFVSVLLLYSITLIGDADKPRVLLPLSLIAGIVLYMPGVWLFLVVGMMLARYELKDKWQDSKLFEKILALIIFLVLISPLLYGFLFHNQFYFILIGGLPEVVFGVHQLTENLLNLPNQLFIGGIPNAYKWLSGTPIIDVFSGAMIFLGAYSLATNRHPLRARAILIFTFLSILVISVVGTSSLGVIIPVLYVLISAGIALMIRMWYTVFPRNPLAQTVGLTIICISVLFVSYYHINRYFVVWPHYLERAQKINSNS